MSDYSAIHALVDKVNAEWVKPGKPFPRKLKERTVSPDLWAAYDPETGEERMWYGDSLREALRTIDWGTEIT